MVGAFPTRHGPVLAGRADVQPSEPTHGGRGRPRGQRNRTNGSRCRPACGRRPAIPPAASSSPLRRHLSRRAGRVRRLTTGNLIALSPRVAVVTDCGEDFSDCGMYVVDRATGQRTELVPSDPGPGPLGVFDVQSAGVLGHPRTDGSGVTRRPLGSRHALERAGNSSACSISRPASSCPLRRTRHRDSGGRRTVAL